MLMGIALSGKAGAPVEFPLLGSWILEQTEQNADGIEHHALDLHFPGRCIHDGQQGRKIKNASLRKPGRAAAHADQRGSTVIRTKTYAKPDRWQLKTDLRYRRYIKDANREASSI